MSHIHDSAMNPQLKPEESRQQQRRLPSYILVTAARNEARFIELTLQSVVIQTCLPVRWIIVSDGSTDSTDEIVLRYARRYPWIELIRVSDESERNFAAKVRAFNA